MIIDFASDSSIYVQLVDIIKRGIVNGEYKGERQIPSTTEVSINFKINPATVGKAYAVLVNEDLIYKKRGLGMFVKEGAKEKLLLSRKMEFCHAYIESMIHEAKILNITQEEIIKFIREGWNHESIKY